MFLSIIVILMGCAQILNEQREQLCTIIVAMTFGIDK